MNIYLTQCGSIQQTEAYSPSLVRLQCLLLALYLMVLPVLILHTTVTISSHTTTVTSHLIHWGMGRFCFIFLASLRLIRKVFKADMFSRDLTGLKRK